MGSPKPRAASLSLEQGHQPGLPSGTGRPTSCSSSWKRCSTLWITIPEAHVHGRRWWDAEDPRKLVLQRAGQIHVEVGRREPEVVTPRRGRKASSEGSERSRRGPVACPACVPGEQIGVEGGGIGLGQLPGWRPGDQAVDRFDASLVTGSVIALGRGGQLQELEVVATARFTSIAVSSRGRSARSRPSRGLHHPPSIAR